MPNNAGILLLVGALCACTGNWRAAYPAPYNTASSEEEARRWRRSDEVFKDRTDWLSQPNTPESLRVYPHFLSQGQPELPDSLRGQRGKVVVDYMVETDGRVRDARVLFTTNARLNEPCQEWVRTMVYTPGTDNGRPSIWRFGGTCNYTKSRVTFE